MMIDEVRVVLFLFVITCISVVISPAKCSAIQQTFLPIVRDGRACAKIVIPDEAGELNVRAAEWLRKYVRKVSGAELTISSEKEVFEGTIISIGPTELSREAGITVEDLEFDDCKLIVKGGVLYLIGRDSAAMTGGRTDLGARGNCKAVVTFLEDVCGVRWFLPGPHGEFVPENVNISVSVDYQRVFRPAFKWSASRYPYGQGTPASVANNYRISARASFGGHSYYRMVPPAKYFEDHPEYFALIDGKRTGEGNHLCSTNPDVKEILVREVRERIAQGYDIVTFGQEDGYLRCQCEKCEGMDNYRGWGPKNKSAQGGLDGEGEAVESWEEFYNRLREHPCERVLALHKDVVDEIKKSHPDKKINLLVYGPTMYPSKKFRFGDTVIAEVCSADPRAADAWRDEVFGLTTYTYLFDPTLPMGMSVHASPKEVAQMVLTLEDKNYIGISQLAETNYGLQGPVFYVLGKLMGDTGLDYNELVREYCRGVFEKAGGTMCEFFELVYAQHERWPLNEGHFGKLPAQREWSTSDVFLQLYTPEFLGRAEQFLRKAEQQADTERSKNWVALSRVHFDFLKLLTEMVRSYRIYESSGTQEDWLHLKNNVEAFEGFRERVVGISYEDAYRGDPDTGEVIQSRDVSPVWFPGHSHFCNYLTSYGKHESKSYFTPWETRKKEVLRRGFRGTPVGWATGYNVRTVCEPLTLDFSRGYEGN